MREALAAADHDYILSEPSKPRSKPKRARATPAKRRGARKTSLKTRRVLGFVASALCVAALGGIAINALTLQKTRHPAPLFGHVVPERAAHAREPAAELAVAPPAPAPRPQLAPEEDGQPATAAPHPHQAPPPVQAATPAEAEAKPHDAISQLLLGNGAEPPSASGPSKTVLAAQKALVKLGFVLKADGVMGATTKQAIERYERDHGRVSHGELTPAVLRRLGADSGAAVN